MAQDYKAAKTEITKPAYVSMTDAQIATAVNALPAVTVFSPINPAAARNALILTATREWSWLRGVADGSITTANASGAGTVAVVTTPAGTGGVTRQIAASLFDLLKGESPIPITSADAALLASAVDAMITANILTAAGKAKLVALAQTSIPQWQAWEFPAAWIASDAVVVKNWTP